MQHFQVGGPQALLKAWPVSCCHRGGGHSHREVVCAGADHRVPQHVAGRLSTALGCEQHLEQTQEHLGLICWLVFTPQLSVPC